MHVFLLATLLSLPIVEVPATHGTSDTLVVLVSGDGGWAAIDKSISRVLADNGMPVVGLNALQYFWTKRTPEAASRDLQAIITTYSARWNKPRVIVLGYSRGADVLPAMINRMPAAAQSKIRLVALLGPSPYVEFEFHMSDWLRDKKAGLAVQPELARVRDRKVLCLWGEDDKDSLCNGLTQANVHVVTLKGAHHFDGGYEKLAHIILDELD
jgi:type IV secretory pathway VirJ component